MGEEGLGEGFGLGERREDEVRKRGRRWVRKGRERERER